MKEFAWQINFFAFFLPWALFSTGAYLLHLVMEVWLCKGWAGGNFFLLANTIFGGLQLLLSMPLVAEYDPYLRDFKLVRFASVILGQLYNMAWIILFCKFVALALGWEGDSERPEINMLLVFILFSLLGLHWPLLIINNGIAAKEVSMEFFQFFNELAGSELDDLSLGFQT